MALTTSNESHPSVPRTHASSTTTRTDYGRISSAVIVDDYDLSLSYDCGGKLIH